MKWKKKNKPKWCKGSHSSPRSRLILQSMATFIFIAGDDIIQHGIRFWSVWVGCSRYILSQLVMLPQPTCWEGRVGKRETPVAVQALLSSSHNTGVSSPLLWSQILSKHGTWPCSQIMQSGAALASTKGHQSSFLLKDQILGVWTSCK